MPPALPTDPAWACNELPYVGACSSCGAADVSIYDVNRHEQCDIGDVPCYLGAAFCRCVPGRYTEIAKKVCRPCVEAMAIPGLRWGQDAWDVILAPRA